MRAAIVVFVLAIVSICVSSWKLPFIESSKIKGIHLVGYHNDSLLYELENQIPDLAEVGVNTVFLQVDYGFEFQSHPELRAKQYISQNAAKKIGETCRFNGVRLIPQFQCIGHQSGGKSNSPLLTHYPDLDLTPGAFPENEGIYCREWDLTNPRVNEIVFPMIEEIVEAFDSDAIHLGMDEIFLIGSEHSPNTFGKNPGEILAKAIIDFHKHFVNELGLEMFIWADRLIDGWTYSYGKWETSLNGTAGAADLIPKDIVLCVWHYGAVRKYPTIPHFIDKGFRVLPASYSDLEAVEKLIRFSFGLDKEEMLGHLFTTWGRRKIILQYPPLNTGMQIIEKID